MGVQSAEDEMRGKHADARPSSDLDSAAGTLAQDAEAAGAAGAAEEPPHPSIRDGGHIIWATLAETAMQASHLAAIFDAIADGVFVYDAGGRLLRANPAGRRLLAFDAHPAPARIGLGVGP